MIDPVLAGLIERMARLEMVVQTIDQKLAQTITPLEQDLNQRRNKAADDERAAELEKLRARIAELERPSHDLGAVEPPGNA